MVVLAVALTALNLRGAATIFSPISHQIATSIDLDDALIGVIGAMPQLLFAAAGLLTPWLMSRMAIEKVTVLALTVTALGQLIRPFLGGAAGFVAFSALVFLGIGVGNIVVPPLIKRYFPDRVGVMTGMYTALIPTSAALPPLFVVRLAEVSGWSLSLASWAVPAFLATGLWLWIWWRQMGALDRLHGGAAPGQRSSHGSVRPLRLWRSRVAWGVVGIMAPQSLIVYSMFAWLPDMLRDAGLGAEEAAAFLSIFAALGLVVGPVASPLAARMAHPYWLVVASTLLFLIGLTGMMVWRDDAGLLWTIVLGIAPVTFNLALVLVNTRSRTPRGSAALSSFMQGWGYLFASTGPFAVGLLHSLSAGWTLPLVCLMIVAVLQLPFGWWATRPHFVEDDAGPNGRVV